MPRLLPIASASWHNGPPFGWPVIASCVWGMFVTIGPLMFAVYGVFMPSLEAEFGWSRSQLALALTIYSLANAVAYPPAGWLIDLYGVRRVLLPSLIAVGVLFIGAGLLINTLWQLYLALFLISVLGIATNSMSFTRTITAWFDRRRGLIIGIASAASGIGVAVIPPATSAVIAAADWRTGFVFLGLFFLIAVVPPIAFLMRDDPEDVGLKLDGHDPASGRADVPARDETGLSVGDAVRTRSFWLMLVAVGMATFGLWGLLPHLVPLLVDRGMTVEQAALAPSAFGLAMAGSRVIVGYLIDRYFAPIVGGVTFAIAAMGFLMIAYGGTDWPVIVGAVALGIGVGAEFDLIAFLVGRYFGLRAFSTIYALVFVGFLIGTSAGPIALGTTFETYGSYDPILPFLSGLAVVVALMFLIMGPYDQYRDRFRNAPLVPVQT